MFTHTPPCAALPVRALKRVFALPSDQPDHFAALLARLALRDAQPADNA